MTFRPAKWLPGPHAMTVWGALVRRPPRLRLTAERWELPDGDFVDVERLAGPRPDAPLVIACHGLEGSGRAPYILGTLHQAQRRGCAGLALHFRSCSGAPNRLPRLYHSGETGDLDWTVRRLAAERPGRPIGLVGFSLGGNVVAKYLGERGDDLPSEVRAGAVISAPLDLAACQAEIDGDGFWAARYRERFLRRLRKKALAKARQFPGLLDEERIRAARTLRAFDDAVTAPLHGFRDAADYYARSSAGPRVADVRRPLLVLNADDDPMVPGRTLPVPALRRNPLITFELWPAGGHVGFVSGPPWRAERWAERRVAAWLAEHLHRG
jgi:hypothetical protein